MRLHVYLARCGIASRRTCEDLIRAGRVHINDRIITEMGYKVNEHDVIAVDGKPVELESKKIYLALNKPVCFLCDNSAGDTRPKASDIFSKTIKMRLFHVGRLDYMSNGLIFYTNDGVFAKIVSHPSYRVEKEYLVTAYMQITKQMLEDYCRGVNLKGQLLRLKKYIIISRKRAYLVLSQGKNREIRRIFAYYGVKIRSIKRQRIGIVSLSAMKEGSYRHLKHSEVQWFLAKKEK